MCSSDLGPDIALGPVAAQCLAIAIHELATNAAKYGALSHPLGRVDVAWTRDDGHLVLRWTESGGPKPVEPSREGFGMTAIGRSIRDQLGGEARFEWAGEGLVCEIAVPVQRLGSSGAPETDAGVSAA